MHFVVIFLISGVVGGLVTTCLMYIFGLADQVDKLQKKIHFREQVDNYRDISSDRYEKLFESMSQKFIFNRGLENRLIALEKDVKELQVLKKSGASVKKPLKNRKE